MCDLLIKSDDTYMTKVPPETYVYTHKFILCNACITA